MDFEFTSSILTKLSKKERVAKYQQLASQAEKRGEAAIANQWRQVADEIEAAAFSPAETATPPKP